MTVIIVTHEPSPSKPVVQSGEVVLDAGCRVVWFLFKDQPFDVGRWYRPDGTWMGYYADALEPVRWDGSDPSTIKPIVDLFLDFWIAPDGRYAVLDENEFEEAIRQGHLSPAQIDHARRVLRKLVEPVERDQFPPAAARDFRLRDR